MRSRPEVFEAALLALEQVACARETINYKQFSERVPGLGVRGKGMTNVLLDITDHSWTRRGVLLPVLVVNAAGSKLPSIGFYETLTQYRPHDDQSDRAVAARRERERVYRAYPASTPPCDA